MGKQSLYSFLLLVLCLSGPGAYSAQIDAEADIRYKNIDLHENKVEFERAGLGFREIISDDTGDRVLLFCRAEGEHNFSEFPIGQLYSQYKGPMGKWNITAGRFLVPFGIMTNYDSEWLLVETQEDKTLNIKYDSGIKLAGIINYFEYALSVTQGIGVERWDDWVDNDKNKLVTARLGKAGDDFEEIGIGLSSIFGKVYIDSTSLYKKFVALDATKYYDLFVFRGEIARGKEDDETLTSFFMGLDYRILASLDINLSVNLFRKNYYLNTSTIGLSYNFLFFGLVIRAAHKFPIGGGKNGTHETNETYIQLYNNYSHIF